jgi:hypothetical protein
VYSFVVRVFHFLPANHGLDNIRQRRLKVATFNDLNDPFELFSVNLADPVLREAFYEAKEAFAARSGLLCFSRDWHNPVLWSHYTSRHTGLCLGLDISDDQVRPISYTRRRLVVKTEELASAAELDQEMVAQFMFTKYAHWRYEKEVRALVNLDERDPVTGLYFCPFSSNMRLATVILGALSSITRADVTEALGDLTSKVEMFKARLAFRSFRVVRQSRADLWK